MVSVVQERLKDFPAKTVPIVDDIVYVGNSSASFAEVQSTIGQIFAGYGAMLPSLVDLSSLADTIPYFSDVNEFDLASFTSFGRDLVASIDPSSCRTVLELGTASTKAASDNVSDVLASSQGAGTWVTGNLISAADADGSIVDYGFRLTFGITDVWGGGGTSFAFTAPGIVAGCNVVATLATCTNVVGIKVEATDTEELTVTFSADPGANTSLYYQACIT